MDEPTRIPAPNYTQIPNVILDLMAEMSDAELRVILAIARQTFGWHKKRDKISLSQLMRLTGMSRQGVVNGLTAGMARGLIERTPDEQDKRGGVWYRLLVNEVDQSSTLTSQDVDQSSTLTRSSQRTRPDLVNDVDSQKKEKERKERERESPTRTPAARAYFDSFPSETLTVKQLAAIAESATDLARWRCVLDEWALNGWNPKSIAKMLDRYRSGRTVKDERPAGTNGTRPGPHERPPLPVIPPARDLPDSQEAARKLAAMLKERNHD